MRTAPALTASSPRSPWSPPPAAPAAADRAGRPAAAGEVTTSPSATASTPCPPMRVAASGRCSTSSRSRASRATRNALPEDEEENRRLRHPQRHRPGRQGPALLLQRHVRALRLVPAGNAAAGAPTPRCAFSSNWPPARGSSRAATFTTRRRCARSRWTAAPDLLRQQVFADEVRRVLAKLDFVEAVGYDNRAHTRLLGTIPAGRLDALLDDLRLQPAAWQLEVEAARASTASCSPGCEAGAAAKPSSTASWATGTPTSSARGRNRGGAKGDKPGKPSTARRTTSSASWWPPGRSSRPRCDYLEGTAALRCRRAGRSRRGLLLAQLVRHPDAAAVLQARGRTPWPAPSPPTCWPWCCAACRHRPGRAAGAAAHRLAGACDRGADEPAGCRPRRARPWSRQGRGEARRRTCAPCSPARTPPRRCAWKSSCALTPGRVRSQLAPRAVAAAPGLVIEGRVGPLVSVLVPPDQAPARPDGPGGLVDGPHRLRDPPAADRPAATIGPPRRSWTPRKALEDSGLLAPARGQPQGRRGDRWRSSTATSAAGRPWSARGCRRRRACST